MWSSKQCTLYTRTLGLSPGPGDAEENDQLLTLKEFTAQDEEAEEKIGYLHTA